MFDKIKTCLQRCGRAFGSLVEATLHNWLSGNSASEKGIPLERRFSQSDLALSGGQRQEDKLNIIKSEHLVHTSMS